MQEALATITSKVQVTIPASVRQRLGLRPGDKVVFIVEDDGTVRLHPPRYPTVASLRGAAGSLERSLTWHELRDIARQDRYADQR